MSLAIDLEPLLVLTDQLRCLPREGNEAAPLLPAGIPIRDLWRGEDYGELGFAWRFVAKVDGDGTWRAYETMLDGGEFFPVGISPKRDETATYPEPFRT